MDTLKFMGGFIGVLAVYFLLIYVHNVHNKTSVIFMDGHYSIQSIG
jgi:hypothetical protein